MPSDAVYEYGEDEPEPDEIQALLEAKADTSQTIPHDAINWD